MVNPNTASKEVLESIGFSAYRRGADHATKKRARLLIRTQHNSRSCRRVFVPTIKLFTAVSHIQGLRLCNSRRVYQADRSNYERKHRYLLESIVKIVGLKIEKGVVAAAVVQKDFRKKELVDSFSQAYGSDEELVEILRGKVRELGRRAHHLVHPGPSLHAAARPAPFLGPETGGEGASLRARGPGALRPGRGDRRSRRALLRQGRQRGRGCQGDPGARHHAAQGGAPEAPRTACLGRHRSRTRWSLPISGSNPYPG